MKKTQVSERPLSQVGAAVPEKTDVMRNLGPHEIVDVKTFADGTQAFICRRNACKGFSELEMKTSTTCGEVRRGQGWD